jgi:hypothetical protein
MEDGVAAGAWGHGQASPARSQSSRKLRLGFVLDVAGYGARSAPAQNEVQRRLPPLVAGTLAACGLDLDHVDHEWTGDGINAVMPADMDPTVVLPLLIRSLAANVGVDNARSFDRVLLRMAVGVGLVEQSAAGFGGPMIVDTNRLVGSGPLRAALAANPSADLAVAISDQVYATVIRPGYPGIPGSQFTRVNVVEKEFTGPAWIWVSARQWSHLAYQRLRLDDPREIGGYRVAARLGEGPVARAYLGHPGAGPADEWVAVRVFPRELTADADIRRRLTAGALAAGVLRGPHIARVVDADTESGRPWVASTLVKGPSLAEAVAQTGPLPAESVTWLTRDVARALVALHDAGLAHQGITPGNMLLEAGGPVLTDFALSRAALTRATVSRADDVFLLGCAAFFAASGRAPWGKCPLTLILTDEAPGDPDLTGCPPALVPVVTACLERDPGRRPAAAELLARLNDIAGQRPRSWLPNAIAARCAEYRQVPPAALAHWARFGYLRSIASRPTTPR